MSSSHSTAAPRLVAFAVAVALAAILFVTPGVRVQLSASAAAEIAPSLWPPSPAC